MIKTRNFWRSGGDRGESCCGENLIEDVICDCCERSCIVLFEWSERGVYYRWEYATLEPDNIWIGEFSSQLGKYDGEKESHYCSDCYDRIRRIK